MDAKVVARLLASDADKDTVIAEIDAAQQMGVSGVPFFIVDQKYAISGAQTPDVLIAALRDIAKIKSDEHKSMN
jgi:predicted DsbA family dithiol-disulfide isomerase